MALLVSQLFLRVQDILTDQTGVRWPEAELLRHLNDGRLAVCTLRPDLYAVTTDITLVAGIRQSLPTDGVRLMDVLCNVSSTGTPTSAVRITSKELLDGQNPLWVVSTGTTRNFMYDERYPRIFHVTPGAVASNKLRIVYSQAPALISSTSEELPFQEGLYSPALTDYIVYRAYMKNAAFGANAQRAQTHYQMFTQALGVGGAVGVTVSPNTANDGGAVPRAAAAA